MEVLQPSFAPCQYIVTSHFLCKEANWLTKGFALMGIAAVGVCIMEMGSRNGLVSFALVALIGFYINMRRKSWGYIIMWSLAAFAAIVVTGVISL